MSSRCICLICSETYESILSIAGWREKLHWKQDESDGIKVPKYTRIHWTKFSQKLKWWKSMSGPQKSMQFINFILLCFIITLFQIRTQFHYETIALKLNTYVWNQLIYICNKIMIWWIVCICLHRLKNGHYVATRGRDVVDYAQSNRGYWTDGEESQRAPSERTLSEYTTANERNTSPPHVQKFRSERALNVGPKNLGPTYGPPTRNPPRAPSALSYENGGDTGSDIYVTSAAYRAPSEYRLDTAIHFFCQQFAPLIKSKCY